MTTPIDIRADHLRIVQDVLARHLPDGVWVWVFGSRATWATKDSSDLDLALEGNGEITARSLSALEAAFEDSDLPFGVDVVDTRRIGARFRKIVATQRVPLPKPSSHRNLGGSAHDDAERAVPPPRRPAATVPDPGRQADAMTDGLENTHREAIVATLAGNDRRRSCATPPSGTTHPRGLPPAESIYWPLVPARDLFKLTYGRALAAPNRRPGNVPVYGTNGRCGTHDVALFDGPGVVLGRKGQGPLGVEWSREPYWVIDTAYTLTPLRPDIHLKFAYYLLKFIGLNHLKDGTSNPTLSRETFGAQALPFPPVSSQRAIAHILGMLDDKIELNRRMNTTLEAMARALFRSWFVDFDPVRAKMEGRDTGLPKETADLFPDRMVDSELGRIPERWRIGTLEDVSSLNPESWNARNPPEQVAYVDLANTKWGRIEKVEIHSWLTAPSRARRVLRPGDTIIGTVRPGNGSFALIGRDGLTGSTGFAILRPRRSTDRELIWCAATSRDNIDRLAHLADGGAYPAVRPRAVAETRVVLADVPVRRAFSLMAAPWLDHVEGNHRESGTLTSLRDGLLPALVSGKLRVQTSPA